MNGTVDKKTNDLQSELFIFKRQMSLLEARVMNLEHENQKLKEVNDNMSNGFLTLLNDLSRATLMETSTITDFKQSINHNRTSLTSESESVETIRNECDSTISRSCSSEYLSLSRVSSEDRLSLRSDTDIEDGAVVYRYGDASDVSVNGKIRIHIAQDDTADATETHTSRKTSFTSMFLNPNTGKVFQNTCNSPVAEKQPQQKKIEIQDIEWPDAEKMVEEIDKMQKRISLAEINPRALDKAIVFKEPSPSVETSILTRSEPSALVALNTDDESNYSNSSVTVESSGEPEVNQAVETRDSEKVNKVKSISKKKSSNKSRKRRHNSKK